MAQCAPTEGADFEVQKGMKTISYWIKWHSFVLRHRCFEFTFFLKVTKIQSAISFLSFFQTYLKQMCFKDNFLNKRNVLKLSLEMLHSTLFNWYFTIFMQILWKSCWKIEFLSCFFKKAFWQNFNSQFDYYLHKRVKS